MFTILTWQSELGVFVILVITINPRYHVQTYRPCTVIDEMWSHSKTIMQRKNGSDTHNVNLTGLPLSHMKKYFWFQSVIWLFFDKQSRENIEKRALLFHFSIWKEYHLNYPSNDICIPGKYANGREYG